jgi:hypothetical protein
MVWAAVAFWIIWHIWQIRFESEDLRATGVDADPQKAKAAIERY